MFRIQKLICHRSVNMSIPDPNIGPLQRTPVQKKKSRFLWKTDLTILIKFKLFMETIASNETVEVAFSGR
jgi:hypothetical protein